MLVDVNVLPFTIDELSPFHSIARTWLVRRLNAEAQVGMPWSTLASFLRIVTNPRIYANPLPAVRAWKEIEAWLDAPAVWIPSPVQKHAQILGALVRKYQITTDLVPDAHFAALAVEHGSAVCSFDTDFARFSEITWLNPANESSMKG